MPPVASSHTLVLSSAQLSLSVSASCTTSAQVFSVPDLPVQCSVFTVHCSVNFSVHCLLFSAVADPVGVSLTLVTGTSTTSRAQQRTLFSYRIQPASVSDSAPQPPPTQHSLPAGNAVLVLILHTRFNSALSSSSLHRCLTRRCLTSSLTRCCFLVALRPLRPSVAGYLSNSLQLHTLSPSTPDMVRRSSLPTATHSPSQAIAALPLPLPLSD